MKRSSAEIPMSLQVACVSERALIRRTRFTRTTSTGNESYLPRLQSKQVLGHEIINIAAIQTKPCPQRARTLVPEPRVVEQGHDVVGSQRQSVESPAVRVEEGLVGRL